MWQLKPSWFFTSALLTWKTFAQYIQRGFGVCHPKMCHSGIRIILSGGQLRKSRYRLSSLSLLPICLKAERKCPLWRYPHNSPHQEADIDLITGDKMTLRKNLHTPYRLALFFHSSPHIFTFPQFAHPWSSKKGRLSLKYK